MGLDPKFFMSAAGIMEFSLAFALLWTPLVRRIAAIVLLSMFVSAVFEFGKVDAIGHMLIIVLCVILAADNRAVVRMQPEARARVVFDGTHGDDLSLLHRPRLPVWHQHRLT